MSSVSHCRLALTAFLLLIPLLCSGGAHATYSETLAMSALYFSKATYCDVASIGNWSCDACHMHSSFQLKKVFQNGKKGTLAFMGVSDDRIVLGFRGSQNIPNWISNFDMWRVNYRNKTCVGCGVHGGFYAAFQSLRDPMWEELQLLVAAHPGRPVLITGHSLGGAMAVLAAADFASQAYANSTAPQFELYTFGAPRVGNEAFTAWFAALFCRGQHQAYRVTHKRDVVPHLPPMLFGFGHTPGEVWYDYHEGGSYRNCSDLKGKTCPLKKVEEDSDCSNSLLPISISNHLEYLGVCTSCSCRMGRSDDSDESYELSPRIEWLVTLDHLYQYEDEDVKKQMFADFVNGKLDTGFLGKQKHI